MKFSKIKASARSPPDSFCCLHLRVKNGDGYNFAGDGPSAGESVCSGSTVMYINQESKDKA